MQPLITAIVAILLLVGGGAINIMLVSRVTELTHEIGIRMAVGAAEKRHYAAVLIEAVAICSLGGGWDACAALVKGVLSGLTPQVTMIFTWPPLLLACGFSASVSGSSASDRRAPAAGGGAGARMSRLLGLRAGDAVAERLRRAADRRHGATVVAAAVARGR